MLLWGAMFWPSLHICIIHDCRRLTVHKVGFYVPTNNAIFFAFCLTSYWVCDKFCDKAVDCNLQKSKLSLNEVKLTILLLHQKGLLNRPIAVILKSADCGMSRLKTDRNLVSIAALRACCITFGETCVVLCCQLGYTDFSVNLNKLLFLSTHFSTFGLVLVTAKTDNPSISRSLVCWLEMCHN